MTKQTKDLFTQWVSVERLLPILASVIAVVLSWASLNNKIDLLAQKVDYLTTSNQKVLEKYSQVEGRLGASELSIREIQTKLVFHLGK